MIALSISTGTATTLSVTDTGTTGYVLQGYNPGQIGRDNTYAESRWLDGAALTSTRDDLTAIGMTVRAYGTSVADLFTKVDTFGSPIGQFTYTVTSVWTGGTAVYTAMPASYSIEYDPPQLQKFTAVISATIPRQP